MSHPALGAAEHPPPTDAEAFLARAEARFVTGTTWNVDGGFAL
jgi:NAD(P)-dependent dehydrogenase (short-subunit alcohol dehydrogenase family)